MRKMAWVLVAVVAAVAVTGCDPRAVAGKVSGVSRHEFPQDGVVCYTYSTTISCVKR